MTPIVRQDLKSLIAPLSTTELAQLETSIKEQGLLNPIQTGLIEEAAPFILDGHNRYEICEKLGVECHYSDKPIMFPSIEQAKIWIIENQLVRRQIVNDFVRGDLVLKKKELVQAEAQRRILEGVSPTHNCAGGQKGETRQILAKEAGLSHRTLEKIEVIVKKACPEMVKRLENEEISIDRAFKEVAGKNVPKVVEESIVKTIIVKIKKHAGVLVDLPAEKMTDNDVKEVQGVIYTLQDHIKSVGKGIADLQEGIKNRLEAV